MAYKEVLRVEIQEVIRRWQSGGSHRQIAEGTGLRDRRASAIADLPMHIPQTRSITQIRTSVSANHVSTFCAQIGTFPITTPWGRRSGDVPSTRSRRFTFA